MPVILYGTVQWYQQKQIPWNRSNGIYSLAVSVNRNYSCYTALVQTKHKIAQFKLILNKSLNFLSSNCNERLFLKAETNYVFQKCYFILKLSATSTVPNRSEKIMFYWYYLLLFDQIKFQVLEDFSISCYSKVL